MAGRTQAKEQSYVYTAIAHDLLQLNFPEGNWRKYTQLTNTQKEVLRRLVETDAAWKDTVRL
jgi:hypothetical protein